MDALPLTEETDVPYKSKIPGKMHACGHDCHTANLLGVAAILNELKDQFSGIIKFMFQPSEECGIGGALPMIKAGILKNPNVDAAIGLHVSNNPINTINYRREISSGCPDDFNVEIHGPGGDAGVPDQTVDVISLGAQFIAAAQTIIARQITTTRPALITFGTFQSSSTDINTIPKVVKLSGTLRCIDEDIRKSMYNKFKNLLASICKTNGATFKFDYL
jgi:amidohydrolase